ncbi:hypothetical protein CALVIDRAFT_33895 [Calocera viscosa TUFC12733]|uniref:Uncharacterized protein n=1 Tax=Calocera viscosa (strain TUFC12733) TaxID=1330018 RepID=A0A167FQC9_CALVF|nr:hypothetical protein CALVIDRAFT_33895 [Calocera viscosa TUFC12733]
MAIDISYGNKDVYKVVADHIPQLDDIMSKVTSFDRAIRDSKRGTVVVDLTEDTDVGDSHGQGDIADDNEDPDITMTDALQALEIHDLHGTLMPFGPPRDDQYGGIDPSMSDNAAREQSSDSALLSSTAQGMDEDDNVNEDDQPGRPDAPLLLPDTPEDVTNAVTRRSRSPSVDSDQAWEDMLNSEVQKKVEGKTVESAHNVAKGPENDQVAEELRDLPTHQRKERLKRSRSEDPDSASGEDHNGPMVKRARRDDRKGNQTKTHAGMDRTVQGPVTRSKAAGVKETAVVGHGMKRRGTRNPKSRDLKKRTGKTGKQAVEKRKEKSGAESEGRKHKSPPVRFWQGIVEELDSEDTARAYSNTDIDENDPLLTRLASVLGCNDAQGARKDTNWDWTKPPKDKPALSTETERKPSGATRRRFVLKTIWGEEFPIDVPVRDGKMNVKTMEDFNVLEKRCIVVEPPPCSDDPDKWPQAPWIPEDIPFAYYTAEQWDTLKTWEKTDAARKRHVVVKGGALRKEPFNFTMQTVDTWDDPEIFHEAKGMYFTYHHL